MRRLMQGSLIGIFALAVTLGLTLILSFNLVSAQTVSVTVGLPASQEVIAPQSKTFVSDVLTEQAQERAAASVSNVYTTADLSIGRGQTDWAESIFNFVDAVRADSVADQPTKLSYLQAIQGISIEDQVGRDLLSLSQSEYEAVKGDVLRIIEEVMRGEIRQETVSDARRAARQRVSFNLNPTEEAIVSSFAPQFIIPNQFFDEAATAARRAEAVASVEPIRRSVTRDEQIIRVGEIIDEADVELLEELNLLRRDPTWFDVGGIFIASTLTAVLLSLYWQQFHSNGYDSNRSLFILAILILVFTLAARITVPMGAILPYLFPMAALSMLMAVVFDARLSIFVTIMLSAVIAFALNSSLELLSYMAVGGILAVLTLRDAQRINAFFRAGLIAALGNITVILIYRLSFEIEPVELIQLILLAVTNGLVLSAGLALAGLFIVGSIFGVVTMLQLQELSRLDHALLKELLRRAPGTYHHSIMVANLAEQAAERVKANSALVRVGAFYHDIGKVNRPPFYTENQEGVNPHDSLDPYSSARIILSHVSDGLEMARRHRLPHKVQDFIATHHGDRVIRAFYLKALERAGDDPEKVDISRFTHRGPRPRSRETGIVLLADAIEAVSSALRPNTEEGIEKLVNSIVDEDLKTGQLDDTGLTLADIKLVRASFIETLKGRFHIRVKYPGNEEFEQQEEASGREDLPGDEAVPADTPRAAPPQSAPASVQAGPQPQRVKANS